MIRYRLLISGRVQGVSFRYACQQAALRSGVNGWVRNLPDGRVEAVVEGPPERAGRLVEWAHHGPPGAVVTGVAVQPEQPEGLASFQIR
ncbi:MAG: acylphosphatase [Actinobacteria bacterium]|nr:acylphosphatase [Actinomycetota bacterium]MBO0787125.1 acylphosphatase [Actinomycetota bacterium]MBO0818340.1 acylphosphatase [Actinomycetota bacterium]